MVSYLGLFFFYIEIMFYCLYYRKYIDLFIFKEEVLIFLRFFLVIDLFMYLFYWLLIRIKYLLIIINKFEYILLFKKKKLR